MTAALSFCCVFAIHGTYGNAHAATPNGAWANGDNGSTLSDDHILGAATLLNDGRVVTAGGLNFIGQSVDTAEIYDPTTGSWNATADLNQERAFIDAVTLDNGKALFAGGTNAAFDFLGSGFVRDTAELYDPVTNTFSFTNNNLSTARHSYGISTLNDGRVLIAGGNTAFNSLNGSGTTSVDLYDPATNLFSTAAPLNAGRSLHAQVTLRDGRVVVAGGAQSDAEIYNPSTNSWATSVNTMSTTLKDLKAFELFNGDIFIASGQNAANGVTTDNTWLFDPDTLTFEAGPSMSGFNYLQEGGGREVYEGTSDYSAFDLFADDSNLWGRYILFAGGEHDPLIGDDIELNSASIYDAAQNTFFDVGPMPFIHDDHTESILLPGNLGNPRVLLFGGNSTSGTSLFEFDRSSIPEPTTGAVVMGLFLAIAGSRARAR